jgi:hypothetical protein
LFLLLLIIKNIGFCVTTSLVSTGNANSYINLLPHEVSVHVFSFLPLPDLAHSALVKKVWKICIELEAQWKNQCQNLLGLPSTTDPRIDFPETSSYKAIFRVVSANILGEGVYERYIGKVEPVPRIPKSLLSRWSQPDPCDPTKKISSAYVLMYIPSHIYIDSKGFHFRKIKKPKDGEAPQLLGTEAGLGESVSGSGTSSVLKVPVTINNIEVLFGRPKTGNLSNYKFFDHDIFRQHGNKRWAAGWICMRKDVAFRNRTFADQQALAGACGVELSELLPRILFNCLEHVRSGTANTYPDGQNPLTYAVTSTLTRGIEGNDWPLGCGGGSHSGLFVLHGPVFCEGDDYGVAVVLPEEV